MLAILCSASVALALPHLPDPQCRLLLKGDGFVVHAVRSAWRAPVEKVAPPAGAAGWTAHAAMPQGTWAFTHTDLKTGRMTKLFEGGSWSYQSPPMGIDKSGKFEVGVAGWAADGSHLYLLMRSEFRVSVTGAREKGVDFTLLVYRGKDGRQIARHPVQRVTDKRPLFDPPAADEFPKLPLTKDGLKVGITEFRYKDGVLTPAERPEKR
jgi:hypothetical protein